MRFRVQGAQGLALGLPFSMWLIEVWRVSAKSKFARHCEALGFRHTPAGSDDLPFYVFLSPRNPRTFDKPNVRKPE